MKLHTKALHRHNALLWFILLAFGGCEAPGGHPTLFQALPRGDLPATGKTYGASVLDLNQDGFPDLLLSTHGNAPSLYRIQDKNTYRRDDMADMPDGVFDQHGAASCDFNNDGRWDTYITVGAHQGHGWSLNQLWRGRPDVGFDNLAGEYPALTDSVGRGRGALWADFDRDATPELLVLNFRSPIRLLAQRQGGIWQDESRRLPVVPDFPYWARIQVLPSPEERSASAWSHNASVGDLDNDGWPDLYLVGKPGSGGLWLNDGKGTLKDRTSATGLKSAAWPHQPIHTALGDVDEDGDLDLLLAYRPDEDVQPRRHSLELRCNDLNASRRFEPALPVSCLPGSTDPQCCLLADLDNDGHLDVYVVVLNERDPTLTNLLLRGHGDGTFDDVTADWGGGGPAGGAYESALALDLDLDGDLDLITFCGGSDAAARNLGVLCYENRSTHMQGVTLILANPDGPAHGLGARVLCEGQMREVRSVATPFNSSVLPVHFGLNHHAGPIQVTIIWPGTGGTTVKQDVVLPAAGAAYRITKGTTSVERLPGAVGS